MNAKQLNMLCRQFLRISVNMFSDIEANSSEMAELQAIYHYLNIGAINNFRHCGDNLKCDQVKEIWQQINNNLKEILNEND